MLEANIVNPFGREDVSDSIKRALAMPKQEKIRRWETLAHGVMSDDVSSWRDKYVAALQKSVSDRGTGVDAA